MTAYMTPRKIAIYKARVEAAGFEWSEYSDCDEWTLSMLFDSFDVEEDEEDYL